MGCIPAGRASPFLLFDPFCANPVNPPWHSFAANIINSRFIRSGREGLAHPDAMAGAGDGATLRRWLGSGSQPGYYSQFLSLAGLVAGNSVIRAIRWLL